MSTDGPPPINSLREHDYAAQMLDRALLWMPEWGIQDDEPDFGSAILKIAARFQAEVAQRLNQTPEKMRYGLLDWLGVRGKAAIPARLPVVFGMTEGTPTAVLATAPVSLQADAQGTAVGFETESDLNIVPAKITSLVASEADALYVAPPGLSLLEPADPKPVRWTAKSLTASGRHSIQVTPAEGLEPGMVLRVSDREYRVDSIEGDLVAVSPPLESSVQANDSIAAIAEFIPFDGARNWQEHALMIGDNDLFQLSAASKIVVEFGAADSPKDAKWYYWGKDSRGEETGWKPLTSASTKNTVELNKAKGEIEEFEIGGIKSRWIRALLAQSLAPKTYKNIHINVEGGKQVLSPVIAEGMANNTPLVLENTFYPLGREPKQFDAFYLGCQEAFSKRNAAVKLEFTLNDRSQAALAPVSRAVVGESRFVGIGKDQKFYDFRLDGTSKQIARTNDGFQFKTSIAGTEQSIQLDAPRWRMPVWLDDDPAKYSVLASASTSIFKLTLPDKTAELLGSIRSDNAPIDGLVRDFSGNFFGLSKGDVWKYTNGTNWEQETALGNLVNMCAVERLSVDPAAGQLVLVQSDGTNSDLILYQSGSGITTLIKGIKKEVQPLAVSIAEGLLCVAVSSDGKQILKKIHKPGSTVPGSQDLPDGFEAIGFDVMEQASELRVIVTLHTANSPSGQALFVWRLTAAGASDTSFTTALAPGDAQGVAVAVGSNVVLAGSKGDFYLGNIETTRSFDDSVEREKFFPGFSGNDLPHEISTLWKIEPIGKFEILDRESEALGDSYFRLDKDLGPGVTELLFFPESNKRSGRAFGKKVLELTDVGEVETGSWLSINGKLLKVLEVDDAKAKLNGNMPGLPGALPATVDYYVPQKISATPHTLLKSTFPRWREPWVTKADVAIGGTVVRIARLTVPPLAGSPSTVWLDRTRLPSAGPTIKLHINEVAERWTRVVFGDVTNPELSWEYWNGAGWSAIAGIHDHTSNLKSKGTVEFNVPTDFELSDWSGKTNYWIRARLVGGDYGKESVTITQTQEGNVLTQKIDRSPSEFTPPAVGSLDITYEMNPTLPAFLVTEDSRTVRNQSDANRAPDALVEVFTPLPAMLKQRQGTSPAIGDMGSIGRSLFVGLDGPVDGRSLNLLFIVDEQDFTEFAPLQVEALIANQFVPLTIADQTRGLGETGIVRLIINVPLTPAELFGQTLRWLRFSPQNGANSSAWRPKIRGLHINAVWASATESLTRELLGSSDGAPVHQVRVARPPVLHDTLELRVREPLSDDQREALQLEEAAIDSTDTLSSRARVLSNVENLPGDWVLWNQVVDPLDESPSARVYALDEATGVIRFGDGLHGMIPPIGQDSIVAFRYQRTEAGTSENMHSGSSVVPSNLVMAQSALNLVSPVAGVETATAAIQSAGGVAAEGAAQVLKTGFAGLRHRQRILTLTDLEDRLLEFASEAVQAKAKASTGKIDLIVCNSGPNPLPNAAQKRQWTRRLLECASPWLTSMCKFQIVGPKLRSLRIRLSLSIVDLDRADHVSGAVQQRLSDYFDLTIGGASRRGWKLGVNATENDIAVALRQVPGLQSILNIQFEEVLDASLSAWPSIIHDDELVHLNADFLQLDLRYSSSDLRADSRSSRSPAANNSSNSPAESTTTIADTDTTALDDAGGQS